MKPVSKIAQAPRIKPPKWAQYNTILDGVEKMQPAITGLREELLAAQKADRAKNNKQRDRHMGRIINILFNLDHYFWQPMFEWAQMEHFTQSQKHIKRGKNEKT